MSNEFDSNEALDITSNILENRTSYFKLNFWIFFISTIV